MKTLLRHENVATTSQVDGAPQIEAKRELQRRLVEFVKQQAELEGWKLEKDFWVDCPTISTSVQINGVRDPYLTQMEISESR